MDDAKKAKKPKKKAKKAKPAAPPGLEVAARYWNEVTSITADAGGHQLGSGGLFVATDEAPEIGALLDFEMSVGGEPPITGIVEVVEVVGPRSTDDAPGALGAGMRVKYVHLEDEERAREVLGKMEIAQTASVAPPPDSGEGTGDDAPRSSKGGAVWDRAVALEEDFFDRASREPSFVPDDAVADAMEVRLADPAFIERQQRLRRTFGAVVAVFAVLFAVTAVRTMDARDVRPETPPPAAPPAPPARGDAQATPAPTVPAKAATPEAPSLAPTSVPGAAETSAATAAPAAPAAPATKDAKTDETESDKDAKAAPSAPEPAPSAIAPAAQRRPPAARSRSAAPPPRPSRPAAPPAPAKGGGDIYE
jgi:hypothetical protein